MCDERWTTTVVKAKKKKYRYLVSSITICLFDNHKLNSEQICFYIFHSQFVFCFFLSFFWRVSVGLEHNVCVRATSTSSGFFLSGPGWHSTRSSCRPDILMHIQTNRHSTKPFFLISFVRMNRMREARETNNIILYNNIFDRNPFSPHRGPEHCVGIWFRPSVIND